MTRAGVVALLALASGLAAAGADDALQSFLRRVIQLDDARMKAVESGQVVTRLLPAADRSEIAAFGVVKAAGTSGQLARLAVDVRRFRQGPRIVEMGVFGAPPRLDDLKGLSHPPDDVAAFRTCRPGACDVKLGTRGLELFSRMDWSAADAEQRAVRVFNQGILDYVSAYQSGGVDALGDVVDKKNARSRAAEYRAVLAGSPYLFDYVREVADDLAARRRPGADDVFYWTKDTSGPKPVVSAYHMTVYRSPRGTIVATRLLGSTHFFNAGLEVLAAVGAPDGQGMYLLSLYRTRLDPPTGMLASVLMGKVRDGIETGVRESLDTVRTRLAATR